MESYADQLSCAAQSTTGCPSVVHRRCTDAPAKKDLYVQHSLPSHSFTAFSYVTTGSPIGQWATVYCDISPRWCEGPVWALAEGTIMQPKYILVID